MGRGRLAAWCSACHPVCSGAGLRILDRLVTGRQSVSRFRHRSQGVCHSDRWPGVTPGHACGPHQVGGTFDGSLRPNTRWRGHNTRTVSGHRSIEHRAGAQPLRPDIRHHLVTHDTGEQVREGVGEPPPKTTLRPPTQPTRPHAYRPQVPDHPALKGESPDRSWTNHERGVRQPPRYPEGPVPTS